MVKVANKWDAYLAKPAPGTGHAKRAILYLPDVIGIFQNSKLIADQFAANGYVTLLLDTFNGDPIPLNWPADFEFARWLTQGSTGDNPHTPDAVDPIVAAAIEFLKKEHGVEKIGAVGYCFGAKVCCLDKTGSRSRPAETLV